MTEWQKQVMVKAGLPPGRIYVKPNFTYAAPVIESTPAVRKQQILFAGQLGSAKGVDLLLDAWGRIPHHGYRLYSQVRILSEKACRSVSRNMPARNGSGICRASS